MPGVVGAVGRSIVRQTLAECPLLSVLLRGSALFFVTGRHSLCNWFGLTSEDAHAVIRPLPSVLNLPGRGKR
jgi:hypothetical protein